MRRFSPAMMAMVLAANVGCANDLKDLYDLALTRDSTLQAATFQRDAAVEVKPQALAAWLPQVSAAASATRERAGFESTPSPGSQATDCTLNATADSQHCYGT